MSALLCMMIIHTTVKTAAQAQKISGALLQNGAACVSHWKISSVYFWKGKKVKETEYAIEAKCADGRAKRLALLLEKIHPYEMPMVLILGIASVNGAYGRWAEGKRQAP